MIPRLRKLEAKVSRLQRIDMSGFDRFGRETMNKELGGANGHVAGYKMALEDLKPVLDAAKATQAETHEWYCSVEEPCPLCKTLRDALAGLEE